MYRTFWLSSGSKAIPGPWCLPLVGYFPFLGEKPHLTLTRLGNKYGPVFRLSLGMKDVVVINSRKLAREALVGKGDDYADRPQFKLRNILPKNSNFSFLPFANALILMAEYPDVQQRVRKEIHSVVSNDQHPSWKDHLSLPFTEAVLLEALRFRPREGVILPHSTLRNTSLCGSDIKKGTLVLFNVHAMHLDQTDWHNPEEFIPERFLDSNGKVSPSTYSKLMTFSAGRRKCIGETFAKMELFLFFTGILQKCEFNKEKYRLSRIKLEDTIWEVDGIPRICYTRKRRTSI
ncbi:cytochrome P450 1A1-like [Haliotis rufescens]|uniref:cytochrome P450 1A1-like n=1 Tax=Haliotis rufescens TaxID=6454 RepID=UPI00201EAC4B|nr:cytochrome P450 1A1-like [Haliotis rufescens]